MKLQYKPEIDGLRTIAVLSVIIYHANFKFFSGQFLKGGFLGVDVFFVISGFLITSLITKELRQTGGFSIKNFYERRARRLMPSLLLVMMFTLPFAWCTLLPNQFVDFSKSQVTSLLFGSNIYWNLSLEEYGAEAGMLKPFLHTWSLAVEEQYYIVFPFFLIAIYRRWRTHVVAFLALGFILSLLFADWMSPLDESFSFYMLPSRFWELLAGGLLASILCFYPQKDNDVLLNRCMPAIGLSLIVYSVVFTKLDSNHPGFATLIPIVGTVLIIWFANEKDFITKMLSSRLFVKIGLISYSLYLWHYPIFAFGYIKFESPSIIDKGGWVALAFLMAVISYYLIERPFRQSDVISRRLLVVTLGITSALVIFLNSIIIGQRGFPARLPPIISNIETDVLNSRACKDRFSCTFNEEAEQKVFLVGDSHMMPLERPLVELSNKYSFGLTTINHSGCQYILNMNRVKKETFKRHKRCIIELQEKRRNILISAQKSIVILGGRLPLMLSEDRFNNQEGGYEGEMEDTLQYPDNSLLDKESRKEAIFKEYKSTVMELLHHGHTVILIYPVPEVGWHVPKFLARSVVGVPFGEINNYLIKKPITTSYDVYRERTKDSFALLDSLQHENIFRVFPHKLFCDTEIKSRCKTHDLHNLYYRDDDHLSVTGAYMLSDLIAKILFEPRR